MTFSRPIALPVLARLWRPGGPPKTALARQFIGIREPRYPDLALITNDPTTACAVAGANLPATVFTISAEITVQYLSSCNTNVENVR